MICEASSSPYLGSSHSPPRFCCCCCDRVRGRSPSRWRPPSAAGRGSSAILWTAQGSTAASTAPGRCVHFKYSSSGIGSVTVTFKIKLTPDRIFRGGSLVTKHRLRRGQGGQYLYLPHFCQISFTRHLTVRITQLSSFLELDFTGVLLIILKELNLNRGDSWIFNRITSMQYILVSHQGPSIKKLENWPDLPDIITHFIIFGASRRGRG